jgi:hypothetical protein
MDIEKEVKRSFLEYSMSVIVSRAIPDVRDGLKPVQRRILYALYDMNMTHDKPQKKSANIVGEVMGKYHPHGDAAIYDTMVKWHRIFSLRYPLVDDTATSDPLTETRPRPCGIPRAVDHVLPAKCWSTLIRYRKLAPQL